MESREQTKHLEQPVDQAGIVIVRLGAMGDVIHALPAAASLRLSFPLHKISWLVAPRWMPLLQGNPAVDELIAFERRTAAALLATWRRIRGIKPEVAFDFQGLLQSAIAGRLTRPKHFWGFSRNLAREPLASLFYTQRVEAPGAHRIERNLSLVAAAGAQKLTTEAWLPPGKAEGGLPDGPFVLASPFAGWTGKEWPLENYVGLAERLREEGIALVLNVPASRVAQLESLVGIHIHSSSLAGLIHATRLATGIVGLDSGPLHLAAAMEKPGVAIFGPTDPVITGPFGKSLAVLRAAGVESTYKRHSEIHGSMQAVSIDQVHAALLASLQKTKAGEVV